MSANFAGIALGVLFVAALAVIATLVRWIKHFMQPYTEWTKSTVERDLKVQAIERKLRKVPYCTGLYRTLWYFHSWRFAESR